MTGPTRDRRRGAAPRGLLGMLILVFVIEVSLDRRAADFTPWGTWAWRHSGAMVGRKAPGSEVLCFGDSLVKLGILPRVIEERTGRRACNLSICAAQAPASYFLLRRALAAGARPTALVVDYKPNMLAGGPRDFARNWPELLTLRECVELSWDAHDAGFFATTTFGLMLPSVRARHDLRVAILLALHGLGSQLRESTLAYQQNWDANDGGQATSKNPRYLGDIDPKLQRELLSHVFWCNKVNSRYIRRFLHLARSHHIPVYWLLPPIAPVVQVERERTGADAAHTRFVRGMLADFPNLTIIDGRHSGYDHRVMVDPVHLDRHGACTLTADVADILGRSRRTGPDERRWIELPAFRDRPTAVALEEIVDFHVALKDQAGRVQR